MFQEYLVKNHSEKVAKGYIKDYLDFEKYTIEKKITPENSTETDIREYILWLRGKRLTNQTVSKKISLLRKYFKWLRKEGKMIHNPMDDIQQPRIQEDKKEVSQEEKDLLKKSVKESENTRDQVIFDLLMDEGIKPNEMIKVTFKDCDLEKRMISLDKRKVPINEETTQKIQELKDQKHDGFLLTNQHGHPLKESGIYWVINNYLTILNDTKIKPMNLMKKKKLS